jgi:hypothetical protein
MRRSLPSFEMLNPRNFRSSGRATALFASLTLSRSLLVKNRLTILEQAAKAVCHELRRRLVPREQHLQHDADRLLAGERVAVGLASLREKPGANRGGQSNSTSRGPSRSPRLPL